MALEITARDVQGIKRTALFESLTITQGADGRMSIDGRYRIELRDAAGAVVAVTSQATFGFSQEELMENPGFLTGYAILRDLARRGLAQTNPDLVIGQ
jgi:hypothetical protein